MAWFNVDRGSLLSLEERVVTGNPRVGVSRHSSSGVGAESWKLSLTDISSVDAGAYKCQLNDEKKLKQNFTLTVVSEYPIYSIVPCLQ